MGWSPAVKEIMWKQIIQIKIYNQASVLHHLKRSEPVIHQLYDLAETVQQADQSNREGHAAKLYFKELFWFLLHTGTQQSRRHQLGTELRLYRHALNCCA